MRVLTYIEINQIVYKVDKADTTPSITKIFFYLNHVEVRFVNLFGMSIDSIQDIYTIYS
jgi:hypothetical protein